MKITLDGPQQWFVPAFICALLVLIPIQLRRHWKGSGWAHGDWHVSGMWPSQRAVLTGRPA